MLACFTTEQGSAIRITPVGEAAVPGWLDAHPESREWISAVGFKGEPGTFAFPAANPVAKPGRPEGGKATGMLALYSYIRQRYA